MNLNGKAHRFGDDINTDYIIPAKRLTSAVDMKKVAQFLMEDIDPEFFKKISKGDFIVAGENFGCGSSREAAPWVIKEAGIGAVIAISFARIFYRNAINIGLPVICAETTGIITGDLLAVDLATGEIVNKRTRDVIKSQQMPTIMIEILNARGIIPYLKEHGSY